MRIPMNIYRFLIASILCATLYFFLLRHYISAVYVYNQLKNSKIKKRNKNQSFIDWATYKRFRALIPKWIMILYYISILINIAVIVSALFLNALGIIEVYGTVLLEFLCGLDLSVWFFLIIKYRMF